MTEHSNVARLAGQVLIGGFETNPQKAKLLSRARTGRLGGIILFARNLPSCDAALALNHEFHQAFSVNPLIGVDQEGGRVARLKSPVVSLPAMRTLGALNDPTLTRRAAHLLGRQLRALGFNWNFAPVLDVDSNPENPVIGDRSFGESPATVALHGRAFAAGLQAAGVLACGKHFPGHGDTHLDSHLALPTVEHALARLEAVELAPFAAVADDVGSIMTAHVCFPAIDPGVPATLSQTLISDWLRGRFEYQGLIVSDDLEMKALQGTGGDNAVNAIAAGCDALLVCSSDSLLEEAHEALVREAETSQAFRARLQDAATRTAREAARWRNAPLVDGMQQLRHLHEQEGAQLTREIERRSKSL